MNYTFTSFYKIPRLNILLLCALFFSSNPLSAAIDWVGDMFPGPGSTSTRAEGSPLTIYVQAYKAGTTEPPGQGAGIMCQIYYGEVINFGDTWLNTNTINMTYNVDIGNNDEYQGDLAPNAGNYEFTCRCSGDFGATWTWVDLGLAGNGRLIVDAPLPVELLDFSARSTAKGVALHWQSTSEVNSSHFDIQRSSDGLHWQTIGRENSQGNYRESQDYLFWDEAPLSGKNFYRLNMVDLDGRQEYSPVVALDFKVEVDLKVYPNPVKDQLYVQFGVVEQERLQLEIYSATGQRVWQSNHGDGKMTDTSPIETAAWSPGIYLYRLVSEQGIPLTQGHLIKH